MIERIIVLPVRDNDGIDLTNEVKAIKTALLVTCGGYSEVRQSGAWLDDDGTVYQDESIRVSTTITPEQDSKLTDLLPVWCEQLRQICLYTHAVNVSAAFIEANRTTQALTQ